MLEPDRDLLAIVAQVNPHAAGAVLRMCSELADGDLPAAPVLRAFGEHLRDLGDVLIARANRCERRPEAPLVIDL